MDPTEIGRFLAFEGAIVLACLGLREWCVRHVAMDEIPRPLRRRVERGNRLMPAATTAALLAMIVGTLVWLR